MMSDTRDISVDMMDAPAAPMRTVITDDEIQALAQSIKSVGLLQPITVRQGGQRYEVIAGHRRLLAHRAASIPTIKCTILSVSDRDADIARVHENLFRADVNPDDEAEYLDRLRSVHGKSIEEIAQLINKSVSYVRGRFDLLQFPDYLRAAVREGRVKIGAARWLAKIQNEVKRREYVDFASRQGINEKFAEAWYMHTEATATPAAPGDIPPPQPVPMAGYEEAIIPCVICGGDEQLSLLELHYCHGQCVARLAAIREESPAQ